MSPSPWGKASEAVAAAVCAAKPGRACCPAACIASTGGGTPCSVHQGLLTCGHVTLPAHSCCRRRQLLRARPGPAGAPGAHKRLWHGAGGCRHPGGSDGGGSSSGGGGSKGRFAGGAGSGVGSGAGRRGSGRRGGGIQPWFQCQGVGSPAADAAAGGGAAGGRQAGGFACRQRAAARRIGHAGGGGRSGGCGGGSGSRDGRCHDAIFGCRRAAPRGPAGAASGGWLPPTAWPPLAAPAP